jgi:hypothetical protein
MARLVMARLVMARLVMARLVMARLVMARLVMAGLVPAIHAVTLGRRQRRQANAAAFPCDGNEAARRGWPAQGRP